MRANELRIGNCVFSAEDNKTGEVFQIDSSGIIFVNKNGNRWQDLKNIHPILLTEELLLKCGFEKNDSGIYLLDKYCLDLNGFDFGVESDYYYLTISENIKYLHQLQNLYFTLTGQEIEINL